MSRAFTSVLNVERFATDVDGWRARFDAAVPFRHIVIDDFLTEPAAQAIHAEFPPLARAARTAAWLLEARRYNVGTAHLGPSLRAVFSELGEAPFTHWLRTLTGVRDAQMDPENVGAGVHQGARGSHLHVHADHNTHPSDPTRYRRLNVLVYLNPHWVPAWGGELELWDADCSHVVRTIEPRFNRCIIMEVHDRAFHGYRRLRFPADETRDSLAAYYYSDGPAALQAHAPHATVFGVERDAGVPTRVASRICQAVLARVFPRLQGLPLEVGKSLGQRNSAMRGDVR
ncbi:MAG: 2OG-Fe(II) oxygenase [Candidatus Eremiobacteraeota bacterium]|nr:2OG-Fe(II) oxygenase [Candidatus Eremiobacteraeota bacterium]MBC5801690.1 2OG-Fe(II) oxygenase [Candidatus Eremiobacteraeota bacterium]MBC5820445.1 2OG-Fe(II) oxygenase [Candidatus Eremiobacteraeota bacterium]